MQFALHAPLWSVFLGVLVTANFGTMIAFWAYFGRILVRYTELNSEEAVAERQRKRELIEKWRQMLFEVTTDAQMYTTLGENLRIRREFMSLEEHLPEHVVQLLDKQSVDNSYPGQLLTTEAVKALRAEISRLARE